MHKQHVFFPSKDSLCFYNEVVRLVPVSQQVRGVLIVDADVVITESAWKEVVYFSGNVEDVADPGEER